MEEQKTVISDIQVPFGRMVVIILKWMLASIPAMILMYIIMFVIMLFVAGGLGGLTALLSQ